MNASDKLQLIRALEEREASRRRRSDWVAWGSVLIAAAVLGTMILAGRRELGQIEERVETARNELKTKEDQLSEANENLAIVKVKTEEALRDLQNIDGRGGSAGAIESAVDNLIAANTTATVPSRGTGPSPVPPSRGSTTSPVPPAPPPGDPTRRQLVQQLFDPSAGVRVKAYGGLLPQYANDPTLVPEVLEAVKQNPKNANGVYNALVVLSHMNASVLTPYRDQIEAFVASSQLVGPRVAERGRTLNNRLPPRDSK